MREFKGNTYIDIREVSQSVPLQLPITRAAATRGGLLKCCRGRPPRLTHHSPALLRPCVLIFPSSNAVSLTYPAPGQPSCQFYEDKSSGQMRPGKKGISLNPDTVSERDDLSDLLLRRLCWMKSVLVRIRQIVNKVHVVALAPTD